MFKVKLRFSFASLCLIFVLLPWLSSAQVIEGNKTDLENNLGGSNCANHSELLMKSAFALHRSLPCDVVGSLYISGLSLKYTGFVNGKVPQYLDYYYSTRIYLREKMKSATIVDENILSFLILTLGGVEIEGPSAALDPRRIAAYRSYALKEYFSANMHKFRASDAMIGNIRSALFVRIIGDLSIQTQMDSLIEVNCFVLFDIPDLDVSEVVSSDNYEKCVLKGEEE